MILTEVLKLEKAMANAKNYSEWSEAAAAHDIETGVVDWKNSDTSKYFDSVSIRRRLDRLSFFRNENDDAGKHSQTVDARRRARCPYRGYYRGMCY